jgi:Bacterial DNA-binding protein
MAGAKLITVNQASSRSSGLPASEHMAMLPGRLKQEISIGADATAPMGRNPVTGKSIEIAASKKIAFCPAKELKTAV